MQLLQAKVRCLKEVEDSGWFKPGRKITLLTGPRKGVISQILKGLEALNPLYEIERINPFADHPQTWQQGYYRRQVVREKKTAVTAVFSSNPELVKALSLLDESLIETDRIEMGRRLDYSRWVSFVEISASARWSDISDRIRVLRGELNDNVGSASSTSDAFIESCRQADRIKGPLARKCREWLVRHSQQWTGEHYNLFRECIHEVNLHERFKLANRFVKEYLPPIVYIGPELLLRKVYKYADLADADQSGKDPIVLLLNRIYKRFHLVQPTREILDRLNSRIQEIASREIYRMSGMMLMFEEESFSHGYSTKVKSPLDNRLMYIRLVCFLAEILWSRPPVLLLDGYDKELPDTGRREMACFVSAIAETTQVLLHPDKHEWSPEYTDIKTLQILAE
ncbi:hypothetical protein [Desulfopila sp. IMCC35008]|uniref:hypothetical protein n=1 Tax=Desulfopila sp. IMCC35008 TaxID=2653858 RepID=UPI0013D1154D|nr:hypothetical protein [Desulfopila sp. IMCC35008]